QRLQAIGEARIVLEEPDALDSTPTPVPSVRRTPWSWLAAGGCLIALAALSFFHFRGASPESPVFRFPLPPPEGGSFNHLAVSPDGRNIAYSAADSKGRVQIWVRPVDSPAARPIVGTDGASGLFWSPDSRFIAFFASGHLLKINVSGGLAQTICATSGVDPG